RGEHVEAVVLRDVEERVLASVLDGARDRFAIPAEELVVALRRVLVEHVLDRAKRGSDALRGAPRKAGEPQLGCRVARRREQLLLVLARALLSVVDERGRRAIDLQQRKAKAILLFSRRIPIGLLLEVE